MNLAVRAIVRPERNISRGMAILEQNHSMMNNRCFALWHLGANLGVHNPPSAAQGLFLRKCMEFHESKQD